MSGETHLKLLAHLGLLRAAAGLLFLCSPLLALPGLAQYREDADSPSPSMLAEDYSDDLAAQPEPVDVQHYVIDAQLKPATHEITGKAQMRILARQSASRLNLELNSNLFPKRILDEQ